MNEPLAAELPAGSFRGSKTRVFQIGVSFNLSMSGGLMSVRATALAGTCNARFEPLRELFAAKLGSGEDLGASLAVNIDGDMVVDLWGGWADEARTLPWTENTIACVFSTTKTMTALAALVLVDRGELDLDANVAKYWPEFAANGKVGIKVRHLLSHTSGVSGWDQPVTLDDLYDADKLTTMLAAQAPWWEPGTASGYHGLTYGYLIGEVIRRITGQRLGEFFAAEIAEPLGADFHIDLPPSEFPRVSNVVPPPAMPTMPLSDVTQVDPNSLMFKTFTNPTMPADMRWSRTERWRRADIAAASGHGNARSVARIQSVVACGGEVDGVRILSPKTINRIFEVQSDGIDLVLGIRLKIGLGYGLPWPEALPFVPQGRQCFGSGAGGSLVLADADRRLTVAYVMNKMVPSLPVGPIAAALLERVYEIVKH
jgi:CubicO group peptidase (beta-lactamase class C family)